MPYYLPQKVFPAEDHSLFLGLGLGSAVLFTLGFFNNFLLLVTKGRIDRFWLGAFLISIGVILSSGVFQWAIETDKKAHVKFDTG